MAHSQRLVALFEDYILNIPLPEKLKAYLFVLAVCPKSSQIPIVIQEKGRAHFRANFPYKCLKINERRGRKRQALYLCRKPQELHSFRELRGSDYRFICL